MNPDEMPRGVIDTTFGRPLPSRRMARSRLRRRWSTRAAFGAPAAWLGGAALVALSGHASVASADEPIAASEARMMSETAEITSVVDAFDGDDPFDLNLTLGFQQTWKHSNIHRETALAQPGLSSGGYVSNTENVASYNRATSKLDVGADIGIYHDLALIFRLPVILSDTQNLSDLDGSSNSAAQVAQETSGLFSVPFKSPNRSGIDWFSVGLDWAIFNQQRDPGKPTWVIGAEGRFSVGTPLHACNANAPSGAVECPTPGNPKATVSRDPGISRGMDTVAAHTVFSRRFGYVEPYSGLWFKADFPQTNTDYGATDSLQGSVVNHPPLLGTFSMGMEVIPWEHREQFQRLVTDFRLSGSYHSAGREYSELFDALGSSRSPALTSANPGAYHDGGVVNGHQTSVGDPGVQQAYFSGITDQQAYTSVGAQFSTTLQAGEYIKFQVGASLQYDQSHLITSADACNPNVTPTLGTAGSCFSGPVSARTYTGIPNPNQRPIIDLPGQRFSSDDGTIIDLWINGVVMF
jgi:hypothetical protein